jgi:ATP-dependent RNA helicase DeaD
LVALIICGLLLIEYEKVRKRMLEGKFYELGLKQTVLKSIDEMGFEEPSQIQEKVIPMLLEGLDVIGQAQTGTGKTLAFGAPIINNIKRERNVVKALILAPTRELAIQVQEELSRIAKNDRLEILPIYGGQPIDRQIRALRKGVDIVVGTPGRVLDLIDRRVLDLANIDFLILDEADEMLNMGFVEDIESIIKETNDERQTLLFSATMPDEIKKLAKKYMKKDALHVSIVKSSMTVSSVEQFYFEVKHHDRFESLCRILDVDEPESAIIFCKTKKGVDELVAHLQSRGYGADGMHGDLSQNQRMATLKRFKEGTLDFLIATDVAARGIDVENITHVINYELPQDNESYVHRIGRTGRANKTGIAYSLVTPREYMMLKQIENTIKVKIKRKEVPTINDIFHSRYRSLVKKIDQVMLGDDFKRFIPLAAELDDTYSLVDVAASLMYLNYSQNTAFDYVQEDISVKDSNVRLFVNIGKLDTLTKKQLLDIIVNATRVKKNEIGDIDIYDKFSFVNTNLETAEIIIEKLSGQKHGRRKINVEISKKEKGRR